VFTEVILSFTQLCIKTGSTQKI